jgi:phenylpyruvate tautomerase PptA (4-oxalocrotonate tautomerase family)
MNEDQKMRASRRVGAAARAVRDILGDPLAVIVIVIENVESGAALGYAGPEELASMIPDILVEMAGADRHAIVAGQEAGEGDANG